MAWYFCSGEMKEALEKMRKDFCDANTNLEFCKNVHDAFIGRVKKLYKNKNQCIIWFDLALSISNLSLTEFKLFYLYFERYMFVSLRMVNFQIHQRGVLDSKMANFFNLCRMANPVFLYEKKINKARDACIPPLLVFLAQRRFWKSAACVSQIPSCLNESVRNEVLQLIATHYNRKESYVFIRSVVDTIMQAGGPSKSIITFDEREVCVFSEWRTSEQKAIVLWNMVRIKNHMSDLLPMVLWSICVDYLMTQNSRKVFYIY